MQEGADLELELELQMCGDDISEEEENPVPNVPVPGHKPQFTSLASLEAKLLKELDLDDESQETERDIEDM